MSPWCFFRLASNTFYSNNLRSDPISERYRVDKTAREWLVNLYPSSNGRQKHLAAAGAMAVMPQRERTVSNCSRRLNYCVSNHVNADKMSSREYLDVDVACGGLMLRGWSVAFRCSAFHAVFSRQNAFSAMKRALVIVRMTPTSVIGISGMCSALIPKTAPTEFTSGVRWHRRRRGNWRFRLRVGPAVIRRSPIQRGHHPLLVSRSFLSIRANSLLLLRGASLAVQAASSTYPATRVQVSMA